MSDFNKVKEINSMNFEKNTLNTKTKKVITKTNYLSTNWKMGMDDIYNIMLENEAIPSNATCINCNNLAVLRCLDVEQKYFIDGFIFSFHTCAIFGILQVLEALQSKQIITQNIYHSFISSFHQYLGLKSRIQTNFRKAYKNNDNEFGCPACPQLKRLKSAGNDVENRLVNDRFIISEDNFRCWLLSNNQASTTNIHLMNNNNKSETGPTSCESNFKATNQIKSLQKFKHLDDTGIFGSTCRHGIPLKFLNLRNMGERYVLAECLIDHFQQQFSKSNQKFIFLYDIACFLDAHIANPNNILYPYRERFTWAVSIFHAYAHTSKCQPKIPSKEHESLEKLSLLNQQHNIRFQVNRRNNRKTKTSDMHHLEGEHAYFELLMELRMHILNFYCINQLSKFIDGLRKERNEYLFNSSYLYNEFHKGQKLASKIKNLNANALTNINKTIENYNQTREFLSSTQKKKYLTASIKNVLDNQSNFWISLDIILDENCNIPRIIMYNAIQNFNNLNRSKEEQELVKSEITRLVTFWDGIYCNLMKELDKISLNLEIAKNMKNKIFGDDDNNQNIIYDEDFNFIEEDEEERYEEENEEEEDKEEENEEEENEEEESEEEESEEEEEQKEIII
ncbi:unnamed protein product [Rhizophagus irregularis]|nr:unnamed protein product [Rhizophagus irregularis]